jgi:hypothetical protein
MCLIYLSGKRVEYDIDTFLVCCSHYALHKGEISTGEDMILRDAIFSHQKLSNVSRLWLQAERSNLPLASLDWIQCKRSRLRHSGRS